MGHVDEGPSVNRIDWPGLLLDPEPVAFAGNLLL